MNGFGVFSALQYTPDNSLLHRMDPRPKFLFFILYTFSLVSSGSLSAVFLYTLVGFFSFVFSKLHPLLLWKNIQGLVIAVLILAGYQMVSHQSGTILVAFPGVAITSDGLKTAAALTCKWLSLFVMITLLISTTPPAKQMEGIRRSFSPLQRFGVKADAFCFMLTSAILYMPILLEDIGRIMQAQKARGRRIRVWNLIGRGKDMLLLLTPFFLTVFRRAERLAEAMESRGFRPGCERTELYPLRMGKPDIVLLMLALLLPFARLFVK